MENVICVSDLLRSGCFILETRLDGTIIEFNGPEDCLAIEGKNGVLGGIDFRNVESINVFMTNLNSAVMNVRFNFWADDNKSDKPDIYVIIGLLPGVKIKVDFPFKYLDALTVFPIRNPGTLTELVWGNSVKKEQLRKISITTLINMDWTPKRHLLLGDIRLTDREEKEFPVPYARLTDEFGQQMGKDWPGKTHSVEELKHFLIAEAKKESEKGSFSSWNENGGWKYKKYEGTGFYRVEKKEGRWVMIDPDGYLFFSLGVNHVMTGIGSKVNKMEGLYGWLPDMEDPTYKPCWWRGKHLGRGGPDDDCITFNFNIANLIRAFGEEWWEKWAVIMRRRLKEWGFNTIGNWSDPKFIEIANMPYVLPLYNFPDTEKHIFRDFPDVYDPSYDQLSLQFAKQLEPYAQDRNLIGYFLTNEPLWALVDSKYIVLEMLSTDKQYYSKEAFIDFIKKEYNDSIEEFNKVWKTSIRSFDDLKYKIPGIRDITGKALKDISDFSEILVRRYVTLPSKALKAVDPNHMNLGMRYSFVSDAALKNASIGYENFDVFSINSYTYNPIEAFNKLRLFADMPALIGEFHWGALDRGLWHVGQKGVASQEERGWAYKYYVENGAAHPNCVGLHYFALDDQPLLGRRDGENFQIGLHDVCYKPYREFVRVVRECNKTIYEVITGRVDKYNEMPDTSMYIG